MAKVGQPSHQMVERASTAGARKLRRQPTPFLAAQETLEAVYHGLDSDDFEYSETEVEDDFQAESIMGM